ncbi:hypothetical protein [Azospirillum doebereinerae]|uniref:Uncharacterized protein n=1 Tax=Azospirillum doebereinerae TaxID=92933 RepID=A0A433JE29_9PROT|nr:hypothetical protein [Azospirillum doebereinerae]RUQ75064.1 hypothetical protein EJ913_04185 [Azospirillum doebereinerae]
MRAFLATPKPCPPPALLARWPRPMIEAAIDALLAELDARDGNPDLEPEEDRGELDHLPDCPAKPDNSRYPEQ